MLRTTADSIINDIRIEELHGDRMVLLQKGRLGFDHPNALKYTFTRELSYQNLLPINTSDIYAVVGRDTIYKENEKVYASYKGKNIPFDKENLYNRGICKKMLGNLAGACEDWKKIKELGGKLADDLPAKYCH